MGRAACVCLAALLLSVTALSGDLLGKIHLRDASNGDRPVGNSPENGIPQGHTLKVVLQALRIGGRPAARAAAEVNVLKGSDPVACGLLTLDERGSGEVPVPIEDVWFGLHHVRVKVSPVDPRPAQGLGQLECEFRIIEGEPSADVPFGLPAILVAVAAVTLAIWWTRARRATA